MIEIYRFRLPKEKLAAMPSEERTLLLLLGHMANQMVLLQKLVLMAQNHDDERQIVGWVEAAQTHTLIRFLIGALHETRDVVRHRVLGTSLWKKYRKRVSAADKRALRRLKLTGTHPKQGDVFARLRNNFSYHHPNDKVLERAFRATPENEPWEFYLSRANVNSFYFISDVVTTFGIVEALGGGNPIKAIEGLLRQVSSAADALDDVIGAIIKAIVAEHFDDNVAEGILRIEDAPALSEVRLPFYVEPERVGGSPALLSAPKPEMWQVQAAARARFSQ